MAKKIILTEEQHTLIINEILRETVQKINQHSFARVSDVLGPVKTTVTVIQAGKQHNVVPDTCTYTIDCRVNELYSLAEILEELQGIVEANLVPRSMRLQSSRIDSQHPVVLAAKKLGLETFGSPTLSDQALLPCPSIKMGPGHSGRSHTADEFIYVDELKQGIDLYIQLLTF